VVIINIQKIGANLGVDRLMKCAEVGIRENGSVQKLIILQNCLPHENSRSVIDGVISAVTKVNLIKIF
jgi:hypothetical protein